MGEGASAAARFGACPLGSADFELPRRAGCHTIPGMPLLARLRDDGITELRRSIERTERSDFYTGAFGAILLASGLFTAGVVPGSLVTALAACCLAGEVCFGLRDLADQLRLQAPAEVVLLSEAKWSRAPRAR